MTKREKALKLRNLFLDALIQIHYEKPTTIRDRVEARRDFNEADAAFERAVRDEEAEEWARFVEPRVEAETPESREERAESTKKAQTILDCAAYRYVDGRGVYILLAEDRAFIYGTLTRWLAVADAAREGK